MAFEELRKWVRSNDFIILYFLQLFICMTSLLIWLDENVEIKIKTLLLFFVIATVFAFLCGIIRLEWTVLCKKIKLF